MLPHETRTPILPAPAADPAPEPRVAPPPGTNVGGPPEPGRRPAGETIPHHGDLVYALGTLGFDLRHASRRDSLAQLDPDGRLETTGELLTLLQANPHVAENVTWTLEIDEVPVYALQPRGPFAGECYRRFTHLLADQEQGRIERVSIPGSLDRTSRPLLSGVEVPVIRPELRGVHGWSTRKLVESHSSGQGEDAARHRATLTAILERVYHESRNLGRTPRERALNYAVTNIFQLGNVVGEAVREGLELDGVGVEQGPIARPGSFTRDVTLTFFDPHHRQERAHQVFRFTLDLSDAVPVALGDVRRWSKY